MQIKDAKNNFMVGNNREVLFGSAKIKKIALLLEIASYLSMTLKILWKIKVQELENVNSLFTVFVFLNTVESRYTSHTFRQDHRLSK